MKVRIDADRCTGDRICEEACPDIFKVNDKTDIAELIKNNYSKEDEKCIEEAVKNCPSEAIIIK